MSAVGTDARPIFGPLLALHRRDHLHLRIPWRTRVQRKQPLLRLTRLLAELAIPSPSPLWSTRIIHELIKDQLKGFRRYAQFASVRIVQQNDQADHGGR